MKTAKQLQKNKRLILVLASMVLLITITSITQFANAETIMISATDGTTSILIAFDGSANFIKFQNDAGLSVHFDSKLKQYKSGGFSMKNYESGILVFGHKINMSQYKLAIITSEKVYRLIGFINVLQDIETKKPEIVPEIIEPKSSIGADISKWNVPTTITRSEKLTPLMAIEGDRIQTMFLSSEYDRSFKIWEVRNNKPIENAIVKLEISRDNQIFKSFEKISGLGGMVRFETSGLTYPLFYPNFCYDVKVTATYGNLTSSWTDDFKIIYSGVWNPNTSWMSDSRYNYLGEDFREEPRKIMNADEHCN